MDIRTLRTHRLTDNPFGDYDPSWSPDGQFLAFMSDRDGNPEIYTMDTDGSNIRRLTFTNHWDVDYAPAWSPDGEHIAFYSFRDKSWEIYKIDLDDGDNQCLTCGGIGGKSPSWSPDGQRIAFISGRSICIIGTAGENSHCTEDVSAFGDTWSLDWIE